MQSSNKMENKGIGKVQTDSLMKSNFVNPNIIPQQDSVLKLKKFIEMY